MFVQVGGPWQVCMRAQRNGQERIAALFSTSVGCPLSGARHQNVLHRFPCLSLVLASKRLGQCPQNGAHTVLEPQQCEGRWKRGNEGRAGSESQTFGLWRSLGKSREAVFGDPSILLAVVAGDLAAVWVHMPRLSPHVYAAAEEGSRSINQGAPPTHPESETHITGGVKSTWYRRGGTSEINKPTPSPDPDPCLAQHPCPPVRPTVQFVSTYWTPWSGDHLWINTPDHPLSLHVLREIDGTKHPCPLCSQRQQASCPCIHKLAVPLPLPPDC